jgi:hypothetical protein
MVNPAMNTRRFAEARNVPVQQTLKLTSPEAQWALGILNSSE